MDPGFSAGLTTPYSYLRNRTHIGVHAAMKGSIALGPTMRDSWKGIPWVFKRTK